MSRFEKENVFPIGKVKPIEALIRWMRYAGRVVRNIFTLLFVSPPQQEMVEEQRVKAMSLRMGLF